MLKKILFAAAAVVAPFSAHAATIDFDNLASTYINGPTYQEDGFGLTVALCGAASNCFRAVAPASSIDADGTSVVRGGGATTISVVKLDGGAFQFGSMDFGKTTTAGRTASSTYEFVFTLADAAQTTVSKFFTFNHNNPAPIVTHTATFAGIGDITKFTFRNASTAGQFDNIVLNDAAGAVPEPATWAMMITGFGFVGSAMRRRRESGSLKLA